MIKPFELFMISQVGVWIRDGKVLLLEDAENPGCYLLPGGRIDQGEDARVAFKRELKEEINLDQFEVGPLLDLEVWYTEDQTPYCSVAYLINTDHNDIQLSSEHTEARWVSEYELSTIEFVWPCGERMCRKGFVATK